VKNKTCKDCNNFAGMGDWDLCCTNPPKDKVGYCGFLCYEDTEACQNFKPLRRIRLRTDKQIDWSLVESPLHTGRHSQ
jgi:hypothetical protein